MEPKEIEKTLFDVYQRKLEWIDRRLKPDTLEFYGESAEAWKHAKEIAFSMYQDLRGYLSGEYPSLWKMVDREAADDVPPYVIDGTEFKCLGVLAYRDRKFPVYDDGYGMAAFIVCDGRRIQVDSFGGEGDWYYMVDKMIDRI